MKQKVCILCCLLLLFNLSISMAGTIHGFLREKDTREPIAIVNVWTKGTNIGTTTNMKGYYVLSSFSDFSAGLYVRAGNPNQNLILLDHINVYNPNHMFGSVCGETFQLYILKL